MEVSLNDVNLLVEVMNFIHGMCQPLIQDEIRQWRTMRRVNRRTRKVNGHGAACVVRAG